MVEGKLLGTFLVLYGGGFFREKRCTRRVRKVATDVSCFVRWRIFDGEEMFSSCRESYWGRFLFYTVEDFGYKKAV